MHENHPVPDYNLTMPKALTYPLPGFAASLIFAAILYVLFVQSFPRTTGLAIGFTILAGGAYAALCLFVRRFTDLERRLAARDRLLEAIPWRGDETVLDVGCGNGILILGAAKRLTSGQATGIDIWTGFSGDQQVELFRKNALAEGVADRAVLKNQDVRKMPFEDGAFDVIVSGLTMHHIGRDAPDALFEMVRVLKPGGRMAIYDVSFAVKQSKKIMRQLGLTIEMDADDMVIGVKGF